MQAYVGTGSQVDGLLGAESIGEFSDRLEFMGAVAEGDAEMARTASNARQVADWASDRLRRDPHRARATGRRDREPARPARFDVEEQASLYEELNQDRQDYLAVVAAQRAALEQARQEAAQDSPADTTPSDGYVPPVNGSAAEIAVAAARA